VTVADETGNDEFEIQALFIRAGTDAADGNELSTVTHLARAHHGLAQALAAEVKAEAGKSENLARSVTWRNGKHRADYIIKTAGDPRAGCVKRLIDLLQGDETWRPSA